MIVKDFMKKNVVSISQTTTVLKAAEVMVANHIGTLPVLDLQEKPVGVIHLKDLLSLELPDFYHLVADFDFVHDFGAVETTRPAMDELSRLVTTLMKPVLAIEQGSGLLRAYAIMLKNDLSDLPVTDETGALAGIISRVDIGVAILSLWASR